MGPLRGIHQRPTHPNSNLPHSTLAAQIADNLAAGDHQSRHQDRESFPLLLREILDAGGESHPLGSKYENSPAVACKLIYVIVKVGLEAFSPPHSVDQNNGRMDQLLRSLQAIHLTISKTPDVLFHVWNEAKNVGPNYPLFAWLTPRIAVLLRPEDSGALNKQALGILETILLTRRRSRIRGANSILISRYIYGCIKGTSISASGRRCLISFFKILLAQLKPLALALPEPTRLSTVCCQK